MSETNPPDLVLPPKVAIAVMEYLASKPWREVAGLITAMQQLKPVPGEAMFVNDEKPADD